VGAGAGLASLHVRAFLRVAKAKVKDDGMGTVKTVCSGHDEGLV